ncbi:MAG: hypothetical protein U1A77_18780 [Pirellulales bacterium]
MKIRLIGIGSVGEKIVLACARHFRHERLIGSLLESSHIIQASSPAYRTTLTNLHALIQRLVTTPQEEMWFRGGLAYLFFQSPVSDFQDRLNVLLGDEEVPAALVGRADLRFWRESLLRRITEKADIRDQFLQLLGEGVVGQQKLVAEHMSLLGHDWLLVPALPLEDVDQRHNEPLPRMSSIGRKLMQSVLKNGGADKLVSGLGKKKPDGPDVDVVAVAFSAGDSFGADGAELIAEEVRASLKDPDATRVLAVLGFAAYEEGERAIDGRSVGRYMGYQPRRGMLDGLIVRPKGKRPDDLDRGLGFPQLLASIALASDPHVIQADNPDANQLQRDFGRRLFAAGFTNAKQVPGIQGDDDGNVPMNLVGLYESAKADLISIHGFSGSNPAIVAFKKAVEALKNRTKSSWTPPPWASILTDEGTKTPSVPARRMEYETARKVIVYVGHNGHLNATELRELRRRVARDFPRARTVVYKYSIDFHDEPLIDQALPQTPESKSTKKKSQESRPTTLAQMAASLVGQLWKPPAPPLPSASSGLSRTTTVAEAPTEAHFALFVVDAFHTYAFHRLQQYAVKALNVRPSDTSEVWNRVEHAATIEDLINKILARSLLSLPLDKKKSYDQEWLPPDLDKGKELRTCSKDSVLGGVDDDFVRIMKATITAFIEGENLDEDELMTEARSTEMTIREAASSLVEETPLSRFTGDDFADILCGLNVICNEHLEPRVVKHELASCLNQVKSARRGDASSPPPIPD